MLDILWDEIARVDTSRTALRSFGLLVGAVTGLIAVVILWRSDWQAGTAVHVLAGIAAILIVAGLVVPRGLIPVYRAWMAVAVVLGFVMTRVILTIVFFVLVTPIGLIMRATGHDPLMRRIDRRAPSYWIPKTYADETPKRLEKYY